MGQPKGSIPWNKGKKNVYSPETMRKMRKNLWDKIPKGEQSRMWKGGRWQDKDGYIRVFIEKHPRLTTRRDIFEHILIVEKKLGRYLKKGEVVHHINGIRNDNRPDNLIVISRAKHLRTHKPHGW